MTMTPIFSSLLDSITTESFAWWFSRASLLAAIACAFLAIVRSARPATRHAVAIASLVAIALLPAASAVLPTLSIPILPAPEAVVTPPAPRAFPFAIDAPRNASAPAVVPAVAPTPAPAVTPATVKPARPASRAPLAVIGRVAFSSVRDSIASIGWTGFAAMTWFTVAICLLGWIAMGAIGARRLSRRAVSVSDHELWEECERACRVLGIQRSVDVGVSRDVAIPMVVGALRPRVVIPTSAAAWSRERLRVVLLHELAHVRRHDVAWLFVARVVTSVFWFHPLVWVLSKSARRDAERACDEIVLASGVRGSDYAEHLVAIARTAMARDPLAGSALAFATRSSLEKRVVSILSARIPRATASRRSLAASACAALMLFALVAALRPTAVSSALVIPSASTDVVEAQHYSFEEKTTAAIEEKIDIDATAPVLAGQAYYLAENDDEDRSGREWYSRGQDLYNNRRFERAGDAYENAALRGYRRGTAFYNAGCSYALAGQKDKAMDALQKSFDEGFDRPDLFAEDEDLNSLRGDARFQKLLNEVMNSGTAEAERREATREFERLAKTKEVDEGNWNSVGIQLLRSGDYDGAAKAFDNEFAVSKDEDALYNKACARSLAGQKEEALKLLEQSISTGSVDADHMEEDPDLVPLHGQARFDQLLEMAEDLELHNSGWWKNLPGSSSWSSGKDERRWRKSIPHFEEMTRKYPKVGRAWSNLGFAQLAAKDAEASTPSFQKALDLGYKPSTTMYNLACSEAQAGNIDGAIAWLEKAEGAGFEMWSYARWDDDLDPLRDDPRYDKMEKRWKAEAKKRGHDDWDWDHGHDKDDDKDDT
jgi:beta-lactamase regulating signal transducer with metallopeptidase domain/Tfp pilus assembly protein PilF